ncbi:hypothetical protein [Rurimicrobium arvi]|uniref:Uncharacterized protein n=1 Tax=Rurimicrobium arvi TaxID=2049916 RepID=A0ABP8N016_9BACT
MAASAEEIFYYGFAEGDKVIFNFEEVNGKELKELEILAMPSSSLFMDYKTKKVENKTVVIPETGIYKFRFANSNLLAGRICKYRIQRIPANDASQKFNTVAYKRTVYDTTYFEEPERYLVKADTFATEVMNQTVKVHSKNNMNGNRTVSNFPLPPNTIAWSYYIGVDQAGQQAYEQAARTLTESKTFVSAIANSSPLAAVALGFAPLITHLRAGEDIDYYLSDGDNATLFYERRPFKCYKQSKVINDFAQMSPLPGSLAFCFSNDNEIQAVTVAVRVMAIQVNPVWDTKMVSRMKVAQHEEWYLKN